MASFLRLVVSGKSFPVVSKEFLAEKSLYYRALFGGNYKDSDLTVYKFPGWSTKSFELLWQYIVTGRVSLKGLRTDVIRKALEMSEYLVIDGFKVELTRSLITSWTDLDAATAFQLAEEFGVLVALREYSFIKILSAVDREQDSMLRGLNFDILILVTGMEDFWTYRNGLWYDERWRILMHRIRDILRLAVKLPPNAFKARAVTENLRIHRFHRPYRRKVLEMLDLSLLPVSRCLRNGFEEHLVESRQNLRKLFSHIRIPFDGGINGRGVLEFNMSSWCWEVGECNDGSESYLCVMYRDYAAFLCTTGVFVVRTCNMFSKFIKNNQLGDIICQKFPMDSLPCCVSSRPRSIFLLNYIFSQHISVLYKFDVLSNEFTECTYISVKRAVLKAHGDILYIVGYSVDSVDDTSVLCVLEYQIKSNEISVVVRSRNFDFYLDELLVVNRKLYIFSTDAYTVVDTLQKEDQELEVKYYTGFVHNMWAFVEILSSTRISSDIYLFLRVADNEWMFYFDLIVARFNPGTGEITCLGFIPTASVEKYFQFQCFEEYKTQIQVRHRKDKTLFDTQEVLRELKLFD